MPGGFTIILSNYLLGDFRNSTHRSIRKIQAGLLVLHEAAIEDGAFVAAVCGDYSEAPGESRCVAGSLGAKGLCHGAIEPPASLEQKAAIPAGRESKGEADSVRLAVDAGARPDRSIDTTVCGQADGDRFGSLAVQAHRAGGSCAYRLRSCDHQLRAGDFELCELVAGRRRRQGECGGSGKDGQHG